MTRPICVIDIDATRRDVVRKLVIASGGDPDAWPGSGTELRVIGHMPDVSLVMGVLYAFGSLTGTTVAATVVVYRGTTFSVDDRLSTWHRFPHLVDRHRQLDALTSADLRKAVEWLISGGPMPQILRPADELFTPLVPLGVMIDGYLALGDASRSIPDDWFAQAIDLARQAQPRGFTVTEQNYWSEIGTDEAAIGRLQRILDATELETQAFREILASAQQRWPQGTSGLCKGAAFALQDFWDAIRAGEAVTHDDVVAAHTAFQLLAAVHL